MTQSPPIVRLALQLPREGFSTRDVARAGAVWRALQHVALEGSAACSWPSKRYRANGSAFVVRQMTVLHDGEARFGEEIGVETWISDFRKGLLIDRQIHMSRPDGAWIRAHQQWAHVGIGMKAMRAPAELEADFPIVRDRAPQAELPAYDKVEGAPTHTFTFTCWRTWMDANQHANHPVYVDWVDEAWARVVHGAGLDDEALQPVAEWVKYRRGVQANDVVGVSSRRVGRTDAGDVVVRHDVRGAEGEVFAEAVTVRRMADGSTEALHLL